MLEDLPIKAFSDLKFKCSCKKEHSVCGKILVGDYFKILKQELKGFTQIAFVLKSSGVNEFSAKLIKAVNALKTQCISVVLPDDSASNFDFAPLFNLPDDVRAVLVTDANLLDGAKYFAALKNIDLIYIPTSLKNFNLFDKYVSLKSGTAEVSIVNLSTKHLIIDYDLISGTDKDLAEAYAEIESRTLDLIDYRVKAAFTFIWQCSEAFNLARSAIKQAHDILAVPQKKRKTVLVEALIKLSIANGFASDKFFTKNATDGVLKILTVLTGREQNGIERFLVTARLTELYRLYFNTNSGDLLIEPDYFIRAERFSSKYNEDEAKVLEYLKKYYYRQPFINKRLKPIMPPVTKSLNKLSESNAKIKETITKLYGDSISDLDYYKVKEALYYGADFPEHFSALTLVRLSGILELL